MAKIGYMGIPGSFSEIAAQDLASMANIENPEYVPLIHCENILMALKNKEVEYGVMAVKNSTVGFVDEFLLTFYPLNYEKLGETVLPIHHCMFKKNDDIALESLTHVASHPQAIGQTILTRAKKYPKMRYQYIDDTAIGAKMLAEGDLPDTTAVICSRRAGEIYGLSLIDENIEDSGTNKTLFYLLKL